MARICILDFIEGNNVNRLDVLFKVLNFFNQIIHRDLLIFNHTHDLQLVDSKAHRHQLGYKDKKNAHSLQHPAFYQLQKYTTIFI